MTPTPKEEGCTCQYWGTRGDLELDPNCKIHGDDSPLDSPKQGPPTLRECQEVLSYASSSLDGAFHRDVRDMLDRLTDEALDLDEKRRAALERIADILLEDGVHGSNGRHKGEMINGGSESPCELCDLLDALTPTPKEKEEA